MDIIQQARSYAIEKYGNQKYADKPYIYHLEKVVGQLESAGIDDPMTLATAYLHDVIEDTNVTQDQIQEIFGVEIANNVELLSGSKKDHHVYCGVSKIARQVKIADRIANQNQSINDTEKKFHLIWKYITDHKYIAKNLLAHEESRVLRTACQNGYNMLHEILRKAIQKTEQNISDTDLENWINTDGYPPQDILTKLQQSGVDIIPSEN
jgi:hypothetical protein